MTMQRVTTAPGITFGTWSLIRRWLKPAWSALAGMIIGSTLLAGGSRPAVAQGSMPQIWMAATEPAWREVHGWGQNDYLDLFQHGAPWQQALRHVQVFQFSKRFIEQSSPETLSHVISFLNRHGIAIAMQGTPNLATRGCGRGIESYGPPPDMGRDAAKVRRLGGQVSYITMDEPLFFGHLYTSHDRRIACHSSIATIAADAARKIAEARRVFPGVQVGETEPYGIPFVSAQGWASLLAQWFRAFRNATGQPLAFEHADIVWNRRDALSQFEAAVPVIRQAGTPLGIIYNGTPQDPTSAAWVADAHRHIALIEKRLGIHPAHAIFQSWTERPRHMMPDTAADTLTGLIRSYVANH
ncbi:MAG: hypothetical protein ACREFT_14465 [Acetobacteraceae bacterium]